MALYGVEQSRIVQERDNFIEALANRGNKVRRLATRHHPRSLQCEFFNHPTAESHYARGTFNVCFFVQFSTGERWVIRIPLRPCLAIPASEKLEGEVATMSLIREKTTIPIPKLVAYSLNQTSDPLSTYIIMEYVAGGTLTVKQIEHATDTQRDNLYKTLANVYIQLRQLEFPAIGRLTRNADGVLEVRPGALTLDMNGLQIEGLDPFATQESFYPEDGLPASANDYIAMRLQMSWNAFFKGRNNIGKSMAASVLYHLHLFCQHVEKWKNPALDQGPFVLVHGDMGPQNLIVNENLEIVCVIDWEWSHVVPLQFFTPPLWLTGRNSVSMAAPVAWGLYLTMALSKFLAVVKTQELSSFGEDRLFTEWTASKEDAEPLVANALENWTDIDWFSFRYLSRGNVENKEKLEQDAQAFVDADPIRGLIVRMKEDDRAAYAAEMEKHQEKQTMPALSNGCTASSRLAGWLLSKHKEIQVAQSLSVVAGTSVLILGCFLIGKRMQITTIPNLAAGLSAAATRLAS